jgi:hypothetical protein
MLFDNMLNTYGVLGWQAGCGFEQTLRARERKR